MEPHSSSSSGSFQLEMTQPAWLGVLLTTLSTSVPIMAVICPHELSVADLTGHIFTGVQVPLGGDNENVQRQGYLICHANLMTC